MIHYEIQVPTKGKYNIKSPYFKVPSPYIQEEEKEDDAFDFKPTSVELLLDSKADAIYNPTVQV
jgi:hypothetical protein